MMMVAQCLVDGLAEHRRKGHEWRKKVWNGTVVDCRETSSVC